MTRNRNYAESGLCSVLFQDHASPRYIFTQMSPLARLIFNPNDDPILNHLTDDNQKIEPEWYIPIIPMVLVNGADGIGTGWSTKIPNYDPREIVKNLRRMLNGQEPEDMSPWFKGFTGTIEGIGEQRCVQFNFSGLWGHTGLQWASEVSII